jgi:hypothetical protein
LPGRVAEVVAISALATIVTLVIAAPVLRAPSERVFGREIVGRGHAPFTVMAQLGRPITIGVYSQPVTDLTGALFARLLGPVAAYNWLVLLSFPLSAAAAYLLARYLALSPAGATVAAMAYAFSPFHVAHAAYHPHIAQTQWVPLYLLALWRCLDNASPAAVAFLAAATLAVTLSNFYGGFIAAVITPVAVAAYWLAMPGSDTRSVRRLGITVGSLLLIAASGMTYASYAANAVVVSRADFAFPRADLFRFGAKWWSYLVPPVEHPLLGATAQRVWKAVGVREGLLEQQVSLGWGIVALGLIAIFCWLVRAKQPASVARVPVLVIVAVAALLCSLSPERTIGAFTFVRPSALLYLLAPMFRAGTRRAQIVCLLLVALAAGEYAVSPFAHWRDVLPTAAHRWVTRQPGHVRALDCAPVSQESGSIQWLTGYRVTLLGGSISDCTEPNLSGKLAAIGYTHLLVRRETADGQWLAEHATPDGLRVAASFDDGQVFAVTAPTPAIYTAAMTGFYPREHNKEWSWRWMGAGAAWTIVNTSGRTIVAVAGIEMSAFHRPRRLELLLDGQPVQTLLVEQPRRIYQLGSLTVTPGHHVLLFRPDEPPTVASEVIANGDSRQLSFALGTWSWIVQDERP